MCNINIIFKKDRRKTRKLAECMNVVSHVSYANNNDGEGYFTETMKPRTSVDKMIYSGEHYLIVSHQRLSTSGHNADMTQPLESENFIIAHNGVFSQLGYGIESDTYEYLMKLEKSYKKTKNVYDTIKDVNPKTAGYYSVVLYVKPTQQLVYYKDTGATMYMINNKHYLLMSTVQENVEYMKRFFKLTDNIQEVQSQYIHDIWRNFRKRYKFDMSKNYYEYYREDDVRGLQEQSWHSNCQRTLTKSYPGTPKKIQVSAKDIHNMFEAYQFKGYNLGFHKESMMLSVYGPSQAQRVKHYFPCMMFSRKRDQKYMFECDYETLKEEVDLYNSYEGDEY